MTREEQRRALFEERYGSDWHPRLVDLMAQPCLSFAAIATQFGVTRERVRQWHAEFFPGAPSGRERLRQCREEQRRRRITDDPLLSSFARHVRLHLRASRIDIVNGAPRRSRRVRVLGRVVALRTSTSPARARRAVGECTDAEFVYCLLPDEEFALARPRDSANLAAYWNTFAAFGRIDATSSQCA